MGSYLVSCGETGFIEIWKVEKTEAGEWYNDLYSYQCLNLV